MLKFRLKCIKCCIKKIIKSVQDIGIIIGKLIIILMSLFFEQLTNDFELLNNNNLIKYYKIMLFKFKFD